MKKLSNIFYALLVFLFCVGTGAAQTTKAEKKAQKAEELKRIINEKTFVFKANSAMPTPIASMQVSGSLPPNSILNQLNSGMISLTGASYDVKFSNDSLTAFLPYYGQAYSAPYNSPAESGIKFTSTKFDYKVTQTKKGNLEILIIPHDLSGRSPSDVQRMMLTVSEGGWANLQITLLTRQRISFSGTIEEIKTRPTS